MHQAVALTTTRRRGMGRVETVSRTGACQRPGCRTKGPLIGLTFGANGFRLPAALAPCQHRNVRSCRRAALPHPATGHDVKPGERTGDWQETDVPRRWSLADLASVQVPRTLPGRWTRMARIHSIFGPRSPDTPPAPRHHLVTSGQMATCRRYRALPDVAAFTSWRRDGPRLRQCGVQS